jgi:hypothetical protein
MQREIEALLAAYLADRNKETRVVHELLTVLAVGSAERKRMLRDLAAAVGAFETVAPSVASEPVAENSPSTGSEGDLSAAIYQWRTTRSATAA